MSDLTDKQFVTLARKAGAPSEESLKRCRLVQAERAKKGQHASLFAWAKAEGVLNADQVRRFERWAEQLESASPKSDKTASKTPSGGEKKTPGSGKEKAAEKPKRRRRISDTLVNSARLLAQKVKKAARRARGEPENERRGSGVLLGVGGAAVGALVVLAVVVATRTDASQGNAVAVVEKKETPAPKPALPIRQDETTPEPKRAAPKPRDAEAPTREDPTKALAEAERLEQDGREGAALTFLDAAIARSRDARARGSLEDAKVKLLLRLRDRLDAERDAIRQLAGRDLEGARTRASALRGRFPRSLDGEVAALSKELDELERQEKDRAALAEKKAQEDAQKKEAWQGYLAWRAPLDKALASLDLDRARATLESGPAMEDAAVRDAVALDRKRLHAIQALAGFAVEGWKSELGQDADLEVRQGPHVRGKLVRATTDGLALEARGGEITIALGDVAPRLLLQNARRGAKKKVEDFAFAKGVLLACLGDRKGAAEALDQATGVAEAAALKKQLASLGDAPEAGPAVAKKTEKTEKPAKAKPAKAKPEEKPAEPEPATPEPGVPSAQEQEDERLTRALQQRLRAGGSVHQGVASFEYSFTSEDQLADWKAAGIDLAECGTHEIQERAQVPGLLLGASSRDVGVLTHALRLKGDFEIEVKMIFNQISPSGQFVLFFGENKGKSTGASFGQQLVKVSSAGVKPLAGSDADRGKWSAEKVGTFKVVRKGELVEVFMNGVRTATAKGDFDGKFGMMATGVRAIVQRLAVRGTLDPAQF